MDLDDGDASGRTADGAMHRDRVAVKRKIEMTFGVLSWPEISAVLTALRDPFVKFTYPDPQTGGYETRTVYTGDRTAAYAVGKGNNIMWSGLKFNLTEQ